MYYVDAMELFELAKDTGDVTELLRLAKVTYVISKRVLDEYWDYKRKGIKGKPIRNKWLQYTRWKELNKEIYEYLNTEYEI